MQINRIPKLSQYENHQPIFDLKTAAASKISPAFQERRVQGRTRIELEKVLRENIDWSAGSYKNPVFEKSLVDQWVAGWGAQESAPDPTWYVDSRSNCRMEEHRNAGRDNGGEMREVCDHKQVITLQVWMDKLFATRGQ